LISSKQIPKLKPHASLIIYFALCAGCETVKNCRITKIFKTTQSLKMHIERCQSFSYLKKNKKTPPTKIEILYAIKNAQKEFGKDVTFEKISGLHEWGVLIT